MAHLQVETSFFYCIFMISFVACGACETCKAKKGNPPKAALMRDAVAAATGKSAAVVVRNLFQPFYMLHAFKRRR